MKLCKLILLLFISKFAVSQPLDTLRYHITVEVPEFENAYFQKDSVWRGGDGASSIDLGNEKILWLFGDSFVVKNNSKSRKNSEIIRNSVAIQTGYDLKTASIKYYWNKAGKKPLAFFHRSERYWYWTGHGTLIKDKLILFLFQEHSVSTGLGFETSGWAAVLVSNPQDDPSKWRIKYIESPETFGTIAGSAAVIKDENFLYAYGAVEPGNHEVYLLRWKLTDAYKGDLSKPEWSVDGTWKERKTKLPLPEPLFIGETEYSVHYDASLKKYIQIQSFGFGEGKIGLRLSDQVNGPWTDLYTFFTPVYPGVKRPFMYSAKAHPELTGDGIYITYNVNSFDFAELLVNQSIYFPKFILLKIRKNAPGN